jgi:AraC family transcriptional regulator, transcriptional activator of pobA
LSIPARKRGNYLFFQLGFILWLRIWLNENESSMMPVSAASKTRLVAIPRLAASGRWRVEAMRTLSEPCLLWFTKGQGRITVSGITRGYTANNAIFIPAGVMHGFEVGAQVFGTAVFFGKDNLENLPTDARHLRIRDVQAQQEINLTLDMIQRELDSNNPAHDRAAGHYLGLLGVWLERQSEKAAADTPRPDAARRLVARYTALLELNFRRGVSVGELACELGITATHLTRCCQETCGRSAIELLQDRRIFEARHLLSDTDMPVGKIGESLGFTSPAYFTRAFQHRTGLSPSAFRRAA